MSEQTKELYLDFGESLLIGLDCSVHEMEAIISAELLEPSRRKILNAVTPERAEKLSEAGEHEHAAIIYKCLGISMKQADELSKAGNHEAAAIIYKRLRMPIMQARELSKAGKHLEAADIYKSEIYYTKNEAEEFSKAGNHEAAADIYEKLAQCDIHGHQGMKQKHAQELLKVGKYKEAADVYESLVEEAADEYESLEIKELVHLCRRLHTIRELRDW